MSRAYQRKGYISGYCALEDYDFNRYYYNHGYTELYSLKTEGYIYFLIEDIGNKNTIVSSIDELILIYKDKYQSDYLNKIHYDNIISMISEYKSVLRDKQIDLLLLSL